ncbi:hypothetical protein NGB36_30770 [Streptomyces sp. RB6PN25]|uniref:XRE family transcriptional regulator n=1 Tax=Streptomyces humicola TaxID=2953240 RepID=A0ABT1Q7S5_9ACTN|nr:hypothetical protein [Streptomyces humicola]MCQ4084832.1 hypothetical protein [Streptomyces humicola]
MSQPAQQHARRPSMAASFAAADNRAVFPAPRRRSRALEAVLRSGPFDVALHLAIAESGLSLESLRRRLGAQGIQVGLSTLSYWQRGTRRPERAESLRAVCAMEDLLGLPRASLMTLLGPPRPRGRWCGAKGKVLSFDDMIDRERGLSTVLMDLDATANSKLEHISMQGDRWMRTDRSWSVERIRRVVAPLVAGVDRFIAISVPDVPGERPPTIRPLYGCRLGRVRNDPDSGLHAAELLFDARLRVGQAHVFDYEYRGGDGTCGVAEYLYLSRQPLRELVLRVHFKLAALPVRCYHVRRRRHDEEHREIAELQPGAGGAIHLVSLDCRPGIEGLHWEWD